MNFGYRVPVLDGWRGPEVTRVLLPALKPEETDLPLAKVDIVCMFSGNQAALIVHRMSPMRKRSVRTASIKFKSSNWVGGQMVAGAGMKKVEERKLRRHYVPASPVCMRPHSILHVQHWKVELGEPCLRWVENCRCK